MCLDSCSHGVVPPPLTHCWAPILSCKVVWQTVRILWNLFLGSKLLLSLAPSFSFFFLFSGWEPSVLGPVVLIWHLECLFRTRSFLPCSLQFPMSCFSTRVLKWNVCVRVSNSKTVRMVILPDVFLNLRCWGVVTSSVLQELFHRCLCHHHRLPPHMLPPHMLPHHTLPGKSWPL